MSAVSEGWYPGGNRMSTPCATCRRGLSPEQVAAGLTEHAHHATQEVAINAVITGPCAACGVSHTLYGRRGRPLCDDCHPSVRSA